MQDNVIYYGDNLEVLRKHIPDNSIDLIYLDPPFKKKLPAAADNGVIYAIQI